MELCSVVLIINGVYDVLCALCILLLPETCPLSKLHLDVFAEEQHRNHPIVRRLMAFWVMTYGLVRLVAGVEGTYVLAASVTYFMEALYFAHEGWHRTTVWWKSAVVSGFFLAMGCVFFLLESLANL